MVSNRVMFQLVKLLLSFCVGLVVLGLIAAVFVFPAVIRGETVEVPNVRGLSLQEAQEKLTRVGLQFELAERRHDPAVPEDHVIAQSPPASVNIRRDRTVKLTLSLGAEKIEVPDLTSKNREEAAAILEAAGFTLGNVAHVHHDEAPIPGTVLAQSPLPRSVGKRGQPVHLLVSDGVRPKLLLMPNFRNRESAEVQQELRRNGLIPDVSYQADAQLAAGRVIQHTPGPGQYVRVGTTVNLVVSGAARTASQQRRSVSFRYQVSPGGDAPRHVRVVVEDRLGSRSLVDGFYAPGTILSKPVVVQGEATLRIYEDNMQQPAREEKL